jgi:hypothetical protein
MFTFRRVERRLIRRQNAHDDGRARLQSHGRLAHRSKHGKGGFN